MKKIIICILLGVLCISNTQAQQNNIQGVTGDLSHLVAKFNKTKVSNKSGEEKLPDWVLEPQGNGRYIGVSDPNLGAVMASEQALLRAWMLSQLDCLADIQTFSDMYSSGSNDLITSKYSSLITLTTMAVKDVLLAARRTHVSRYGEYFVEFYELDIPNSDPSQFGFNKDVKSEIVLKEYTEINSVNNKHSIKINLDGRITYSTYIDYMFPLHNSTTPTTEANCSYASTIQDGKKSTGGIQEIQNVLSPNGDVVHQSELHNGYWYSVISSMLCSASDYSSQINTQITYSTSGYSSQNNTQVTSDDDNSLTEEIHSNSLRLSLSSVAIKGDGAYICWDIESVND